jgi:phospholipase/carboxylesterase
VDDGALDDLVALLPPLLRSLEGLGFVARHLDPPRFAAVMAAVGEPDQTLREALPRLEAWPERLADVRGRLQAAAGEALAAFEELRAAAGAPDGVRGIFRALRHGPRAQEALYPLAAGLPPVSRFFLEPGSRDDAALQRRIFEAEPLDGAGVSHFDNEPGSRGGFSLYVPEYYAPDRTWPLVVAMHGGSGNGRGFLWSWLRDARSHGAILISPTATGETWALMGPDADTPNLMRMLELVRGRWNVDPARLLLTGMSDGGTFSYVSGLEAASPFTHLAPISAAFHPMMAAMAEPERLRGLPIFITHGARDWMFPAAMARQAHQALAAAGAKVRYNEIADLSHTYPHEANRAILEWLG